MINWAVVVVLRNVEPVVEEEQHSDVDYGQRDQGQAGDDQGITSEALDYFCVAFSKS